MIENEIYCYINGFLKWNSSKNTSYIVEIKKFSGKIFILNLRNKRKIIFARVIIRIFRWKTITKETGRSRTRSRTSRIQFIIFNFVKNSCRFKFKFASFKNFVLFIQIILSFFLSKKIINIYKDIPRKYGNFSVKDFRKYEKLEYKKSKLKLDIDFLNNWKQLGVYPKFLIFKLLDVSNKEALSFRKNLLRSAINKHAKKLAHFPKELSLSKNFLSKQLSTTDFYILTKSITLHNQKLLQQSLYTEKNKLIFTTEGLQLTYIHS